MKKGLIIVFLALLLAGCSGSASKGLSVKEAWARPAPAGGTSAAYFTVDNPTADADTLLSATTSVAAVAELHESMMDSSGTMSMAPQDNVPIPAKGQTQFKPGGLHVMLINLPKDLKVGDHFTLILAFKNAGDVQVDVTVREP